MIILCIISSNMEARLYRCFPHSVIVRANYAQFGPSQKISFPAVKSRMLLWCKSGFGRIVVNGHEINMAPHKFVFLPWNHQIKYEASEEDPFFVGGVHVIPNHSATRHVSFEVAHRQNHPLASVSFRKDMKVAGINGVFEGWLRFDAPLYLLAEYCVQIFGRSQKLARFSAQSLANELLGEIILYKQRENPGEMAMPAALEKMREYVEFNIQKPLSLNELVNFSGLSASTVGRLFRANYKLTPVEWILRKKIDRAKILLSTRRMPIKVVAEQVGIPDPYYFSKVFKRLVGKSPKEFKEVSSWF